MKLIPFFIVLLLFSLSYADSIDTLLKSYEKESELSNKTKSESAGNLIVYTRDDLKRMQVENLKDILKSLRGFTYLESRLGQPDMLNQDPLAYYSKTIRVYLNENELLTAITGSGLIVFGNMEMDLIDHVEIYEGFPSFDFGVEPATVVIRLYTKSPKHDEGGRLKVSLGSNNSHKENVYYTGRNEELSYFMYANHTTDNYDQYPHEGKTLRRDRDTDRFYGMLSNDKHTFEFHAMNSTGDAFLGSLTGNIPEKTSLESYYINANLNSKFQNDTLLFHISYIDALNDFSYRYDPAAPSAIPTSLGLVPINRLDQKVKEEALSTGLKKKWFVDAHTLTAGLQFRYKHFDLTDAKFDITTPPIVQAYYQVNIYSAFIQDSISLDDNNLVTLSVMHQTYDRKGNVNKQNTLQLRLGYVYTNEDWVAKTFISSQEFASEPYMTISPHYGNSNLEAERYTSIFQEFAYKTDSTLSKVVVGYGRNEKIPIVDNNFVIQNSTIDIDGWIGALEFTYMFNENDKLELQSNYAYIESPYGGSSTHHHQNVIRMLNSVKNVDIFNELVMHGGFAEVETAYDYSAGLKYAYNEDLFINIKGENIFNKGLKSKYLNRTTPVLDKVTIPVIERRFTIGMEYLF